MPAVDRPLYAAPRVTVITAIYNGRKYLAEALDSVLAQDFDDFELLLVDDGSADGSDAIARDYAARLPGRIFYFEHKGHVNRGLGASRNLGLAHARGEFIAFLDADDRWRRSKLREQLALMERYPEVGVVAGTANYWNNWNGGEDVLVPTGHVQGKVLPPPEAALELYPLGRAMTPCPSDFLVRHYLIRRVGGPDERFVGMFEDISLLIKLWLETSAYFSKNVWIDYRLHEESLVAKILSPDQLRTGYGKYHQVKNQFLQWFAEYLSTLPQWRNNSRLRFALWRASLRYRHPWLVSLARTVRNLRFPLTPNR